MTLPRKDMSKIESTYRRFVDARVTLLEFVKKHEEVFDTFAELADSFNEARDSHLDVLKDNRTDSPLFKMSIPKTFECSDIEGVQKILKERFPEFFDIIYKPKGDPIRNALAAETIPGLELYVTEVEQTPRHTGPKEIDISALSEAKKRRR